MTGDERKRFLADQLNAAILETLELMLAEPAETRLTEDHASARILTLRLIGELGAGALPFCKHLPATVPAVLLWSTGSPTLNCGACANAYVDANTATGCATCDAGVDASMHPFVLGVGPIAITGVICGPCRRKRSPGTFRAVNLTKAAETVAGILLARYEDAQ